MQPGRALEPGLAQCPLAVGPVSSGGWGCVPVVVGPGSPGNWLGVPWQLGRCPLAAGRLEPTNSKRARAASA
eukprot:365896-Chlamydomonas_euryale.AAC.3